MSQLTASARAGVLLSSGRVLERVASGESFTVTRDGHPIAEIRPLARHPLPAAALVARRLELSAVGLEALWADIDAVLDPSL